MQQFLSFLDQLLKNKYSGTEIQTLGYLLLEKTTGLTRTQLLTDRRLLLTDIQMEHALVFAGRLQNDEPVQYIIGETEFYGLPFKVNPSVLIPRPETEELVQWIVDDLRLSRAATDNFSLLDIGTGSGCIAIAVKTIFGEMHVAALDVSAGALEVARENAMLNLADIEFIQDDILNSLVKNRKWNVIVSNPPYIPLSDKAGMDRNVIDFEPYNALFVSDDDPLVFYRTIAEFARINLHQGGKLYVEIHRNYADECKRLFEKSGFSRVEIRRDISGNSRMVKAE